jgi:hypothetical protein
VALCVYVRACVCVVCVRVCWLHQDSFFSEVKHAMVRVLLTLVEHDAALPALIENQVVSVLSSVIRPGVDTGDSKVRRRVGFRQGSSVYVVFMVSEVPMCCFSISIPNLSPGSPRY